MGTTDFWVAALAIPLIVVVGNGFIRAMILRVPQTSAADLVLAFMVFDAVVILNSEEFKKFAASEILKGGLRGYQMAVLFITFFLCISSGEKNERSI